MCSQRGRSAGPPDGRAEDVFENVMTIPFEFLSIFLFFSPSSYLPVASSASAGQSHDEFIKERTMTNREAVR